MIAHRTGGPAAPKVGDYARRRFLRLYPAYWVVLTFLALAPGLYGVFSDNWWAFYTLTSFIHLPLQDVCPADKELLCGLPQSWTLGVDMTFYVALPFYAALSGLIAHRLDPRRWVPIELGLLAVLGLASLFLGGPPFSLREHDWYRFTLLGHFFWFALGLGLAVISALDWRHGLLRAVRAMAARPGLCWLGAAVIYAITVVSFYPSPFIIAPFLGDWEYNTLNLVQGAEAILLFIPAVFGNPNRGLPARVLGSPQLIWVGLISYGLLLWNTTFAVLLGEGGAELSYWPVLIAGTVLSVPLSAASYYIVERPLMKFKYRSPREVFREWRQRPLPEQAGR